MQAVSLGYSGADIGTEPLGLMAVYGAIAMDAVDFDNDPADQIGTDAMDIDGTRPTAGFSVFCGTEPVGEQKPNPAPVKIPARVAEKITQIMRATFHGDTVGVLPLRAPDAPTSRLGTTGGGPGKAHPAATACSPANTRALLDIPAPNLPGLIISEATAPSRSPPTGNPRTASGSPGRSPTGAMQGLPGCCASRMQTAPVAGFCRDGGLPAEAGNGTRSVFHFHLNN